MATETKAANGKTDTDKLVEQRVQEELRRRGIEDAKGKMTDEQRALCTIIADEVTARVAEKIKAQQVTTANADGDEGATEDNRPKYGNGLFESDDHRKWRREMEKKGYKFSGWDNRTITARPGGAKK